MNTDVLPLLESLDADDAVYTREALQDRLPLLIDTGWPIWVAAFSHMHTRFNRHLFLNAPELWSGMSVQTWNDVMLSIDDRSYAPGDVFSTGRFDDIKFLCQFVAVDAIRWYFQIAKASIQDHHAAQQWVTQHVRACTFMYLPMANPSDELEGVHVNPEQLADYRTALQKQSAELQVARAEEVLVLQGI